MPNYTGSGQTQLLYENRQALLWNNESVSAGQLSIAYQLRRVLGSFYPWSFSVEVQFSGTPGAFELDVMAAETDNKANYVKIGSITSVNSSNVGRLDLTTYYPRYVAAYLASLTNSVTTTVKLTR